MAPTSLGPLEPLVQTAGRSRQSARRALERPITWALLTGLDRSLSALDIALSSSLAREALGRILASPVVDDVVDRVLAQARPTFDTHESGIDPVIVVPRPAADSILTVPPTAAMRSWRLPRPVP